jgi:L-2-hydroxycarboxylate dehydrogenase (NAD+)
MSIPSNSSNSTAVTFEQLQTFITNGLQAAGLPLADANKVATLMAEADLQGSDGHGVIRLVPYVKRIMAGGINTQPNIHVVNERTAMAVVDGDNGMGHLVMSYAAKLAIAKARTAA